MTYNSRHRDGRVQILEAVVGSRLHGNARPDSDTDIMGIHVDATMDLVGITPPPPHTVRSDLLGWDYVSWEVGFFISKALECEQNALEVLWAEEYITKQPHADALIDIRSDFLSQRVRKKWLGFANGQLADIKRKIQLAVPGSPAERRVNKGAFHLVRTLETLVPLWTEGRLVVQAETPASEIEQWVADNIDDPEYLIDRLDKNIERVATLTETTISALPEEPYIVEIEKLLASIREENFHKDGWEW